MTASKDRFIFATRPSDLAIRQTQGVIDSLQAVWPEKEFEKEVIVTKGDQVIEKPLPEIGGKGLFTYELEQALFSENVDAAVHSLKDLPIESPPGLIVGGIPVRADVRDVLISKEGYTLASLPENARVGTSSLRRTAQLKTYRQDLEVVPLRGNVDTRVEKAYSDDHQYDAIVLAAAGVTRSDLDEHVSQFLPLEIMLPAPAQGALGVQCREDDQNTLSILSAIEEKEVRDATDAERSFLFYLGGGCALPVAAYAEVDEDQIYLRGLVAAVDGSGVVRVEGRGTDPLSLGESVADEAIKRGAKELLDV